MLIENVVAPDTFRNQRSQRKRRAEEKQSEAERRQRLEDN